MLAPSTRYVYLDALRPPAGFSMDRAIGTTYSLDLETLLTVPLGFAMLDWENERGALARDPVALLHALRRCADRVTMFCQAGRIGAPTRHHPLFAHLERMAVEVNAPDPTGSFHSKTWLLRFVDDEQRVMYRFICLSRNLTPDRSWDTILALDGELAERERAIARNHPLGDFVAALSGLAQREIEAARREAVAQLADEVRRVKFEIPQPFEELVFWPMGLPRMKRSPLDERIDRLLVVSPFVSEQLLTELDADILVSRPESLETIDPMVLKHAQSVHVLDDAAVEEETDDAVDGSLVETHRHAGDARGLHAKLFIADQGWYASLWTGSANATTSAFGRNVEFMVQLSGKRKDVGIDAFLKGKEGNGFQNLLRPFPIRERAPVDPEIRANEKRAEDLRRAFAGAGLRLFVESGSDGCFELSLCANADDCPDTQDVNARCWPAAVSPSMARDVDRLRREGAIRFGGVTVQQLSSFVAFEITVGDGAKGVSVRFALNLPLAGAPEDRLDRVLQAVLGNRERLLRYLLFLLARDENVPSVAAALLSWNEGAGGSRNEAAVSLPLFEELLRALARAPSKLDTVARLVEDLKRTTEGAALLPDGFDEMWQAIWVAKSARVGEIQK